jgi:TolB-like protein
VCAGDDDLRRELDSLITHDELAGAFLEAPPMDVAADLFPEEHGFDEGRLIGNYQIISMIGSGGMGEVYLAKDQRLNRTVALKVLAPSVAFDPAYRRRFEEEARLASNLNHPNIVTIYGVGDEGDLTYIAMELVRGRTLRNMLADGAMPVKTVLDIALQIADALTAAHEGRVVHRDLKPENIMVTGNGLVKVLDFGLARQHRIERDSKDKAGVLTAMTGAGMILGTVGYMSPEQASGKVAEHTADQFSFGAILYEMLSGRRAFERETAAETLSAIIKEQPPAIPELGSIVSAPLQKVLDRCLAKVPADRFPITRELAIELQRIRDRNFAATDAAPPIADPVFAVPPMSRRRAIRIGAAAVASAAAVLAGWRLLPDASGIRSLGILPFANASHNDKAEFVRLLLQDDLIRRLGDLQLIPVKRGSGPTMLANTVDEQTAGRQLDVDAVLTGWVADQSGDLTVTARLEDVRTGEVLWTDTYEKSRAADLIPMQVDIAKAVADKIRLKLSPENRLRLDRRDTNDSEAYLLYARVERPGKRSEAGYIESRKLLQEAVNKDPKFALAYVGLAHNYIGMALDGFESPNAPQVKAYLQKAREMNSTLMDIPYAEAAEAFFFEWDWPGAIKEFELASRNPAAREGSVWAFALWATGNTNEALRVINNRLHYDPLNPDGGLLLANILFYNGQIEIAQKRYEALISKGDSSAYYGLVELMRSQGHYDEAIQKLREGLQAMKEQGEDLDESLEELLTTAKGEAGYRAIEKKRAEEERDTMLARQSEGGYVSPLDYARVYARLNNRDEAIKYLKDALKERSPGLVFLKVDPVWEPLRKDKEFAEVVRAVGLP